MGGALVIKLDRGVPIKLDRLRAAEERLYSRHVVPGPVAYRGPTSETGEPLRIPPLVASRARRGPLDLLDLPRGRWWWRPPPGRCQGECDSGTGEMRATATPLRSITKVSPRYRMRPRMSPRRRAKAVVAGGQPARRRPRGREAPGHFPDLGGHICNIEWVKIACRISRDFWQRMRLVTPPPAPPRPWLPAPAGRNPRM